MLKHIDESIQDSIKFAAINYQIRRINLYPARNVEILKYGTSKWSFMKTYIGEHL
jgi:hypothetical protein